MTQSDRSSSPGDTFVFVVWSWEYGFGEDGGIAMPVVHGILTDGPTAEAAAVDLAGHVTRVDLNVIRSQGWFGIE
jgi:hypothetical protein